MTILRGRPWFLVHPPLINRLLRHLSFSGLWPYALYLFVSGVPVCMLSDYMRKSVGQAPIAGEQTQQKPCRTSSDIGAELENHTIGRGPM
jgi:hypothetical protein